CGDRAWIEDRYRYKVAVVVKGLRLREVSATLQRRRKCRDRLARAYVPQLFKIEEEEGLVLPDWPAYHAAVLILNERRLRLSSGMAEEIVGVERVPLAEVPATAV